MKEMKKMFILLPIMLVMMMGMIKEAYSVPINPGFETGNTTGWTLSIPPNGSATVVGSHAAESTTYLPMEGSYFLQLKTNGPGSYTTASQTLAMGLGETLSGWAAFDAHDYMPYNDNAYVKIFNTSESLLATPWSSSVSIVGSYGDGPWTSWSWTAPAGGTYVLEYGLANALDGAGDSHALFDAAASAPVPEPATIALLGTGLLGMLGYTRRRFWGRRS